MMDNFHNSDTKPQPNLSFPKWSLGNPPFLPPDPSELSTHSQRGFGLGPDAISPLRSRHPSFELISRLSNARSTLNSGSIKLDRRIYVNQIPHYTPSPPFLPFLSSPPYPPCVTPPSLSLFRSAPSSNS